MDKARFSNKGFIVVNASDVELETESLSPNYAAPVANPDPTAHSTGHLWLFRIDPLRAGLPAFVGRFGHDDHQSVDVDWQGDKAGREAFATSKPGYTGHKTKRISDAPCQYKVYIEIPSEGVVFSGILTIGTVGLGARAKDRVEYKDAVESHHN